MDPEQTKFFAEYYSQYNAVISVHFELNPLTWTIRARREYRTYFVQLLPVVIQFSYSTPHEYYPVEPESISASAEYYSGPLVRAINQTNMKDRKCTFTCNREVQGNWQKEENVKGKTLTDIMQKSTEKGTFAVVLVEEEATGQVHEVFANTIKFEK